MKKSYILAYLSLAFTLLGYTNTSSYNEIGNQNITFINSYNIEETFDSVAGAAVAKRKLKDLALYIQGRKISRLNSKPSKGALLVGTPGNGKTLLAKALAKESRCNFISVSAGNFSSSYVGENTKTLKSMFDMARKNSPCIIFIDEIDSIASARMSTEGHNGVIAKEHNHFIAEFLAQLDGLGTKKDEIFVIGATNRPEDIDKALKRPGRLNKEIVVPAPDFEARLAILQMNTKTTPLDADVDLQQVARVCRGMSGVEIVEMVRLATEYADQQYASQVSANDFEQARDTILMGQENPDIIYNDKESWKSAVREAGHALVCLVLGYKELYKVTIIPRGTAGGATQFLPKDEHLFPSRHELLADIITLLASGAAEELLLGDSTPGISDDIFRAEKLARTMVRQFGMSELGASATGSIHEVSEELKTSIDKACQRIIQYCQSKAKKILATNKKQLQKLAIHLMEQKTITGEQAIQLLNITPGDYENLNSGFFTRIFGWLRTFSKNLVVK